MVDGCSAWRRLHPRLSAARRPGAGDGGAVRLHQFVERVPRRADLHEPGNLVHRADPAGQRAHRRSRRGRLGRAAGERRHFDHPLPCRLSGACSATTSPACSRARSNERRCSDGLPPEDETLRQSTRTIRDVARLAGVSIGTASKALNASGRLSAETRARVLRVAGEIGYRPNDLAQSLHRARSMTVGILSNDSFGRFTFPIVEALERSLSDSRHRGLHVQRDRRPRARAPAHRAIARQARRRPCRHRAPRRQARADRAGGRRLAGRLCVLAGREPGRALPAARRRGRRAARGQAPRRARPQAHRPYHRPGTLRGGAPARGGLSRRARGSRTVGAAGDYRPGRWSEAWGREAVRDLFSNGAARRTRSFAATTRSPAARSTRCARWAVAVPGRCRGRRLRQLGRDGGGRPAAADQRRHEPRRARPRGGRLSPRHDGAAAPSPACAGCRVRSSCSDSCGAEQDRNAIERKA